MTFYHGSPISGIKELGTRSTTHDKTKSYAVYLTPNRAYALFYIRDLEINHVTCCVTTEGYIRYYEQFPDQLKKLYQGINGYLYICNQESHFEKTNTLDVWVSRIPALVERVEYIADVYDEILKYENVGSVKVVRYETLTDERKQEIYEMMVYSIYKNNRTLKDTKKSAFYSDNFPEAWQYVVEHPEDRQIKIDDWEKKKQSPAHH